MSALRPEQIHRILELTDSFNLHREAIYIPLTTEEDGSVTILADGRLKIVCPRTEPFEMSLRNLRARLEKMDLSKVGH
jgi:hypothetical protein